MMRAGALGIIVRVGFIAGTLDIIDALIFSKLHGVNAERVFQFIAGGILGLQSFRAGTSSVWLGLALHYLIALIWAGIFYAASLKFPILRRKAILSGVLYGAAVYVFMNSMVLPLSAVPHATKPATIASRINGVLAVVVFIGLAISLLTRRIGDLRD